MRHTGLSDVSVVDRVASILEAFGTPQESVTLTDICAYTQMPKATVHRILRQLIAIDMVCKVEGGYSLGWRLWAISRHSVYERLRDLARPHLQLLNAHTSWTVHLATLQGADVVYLDKVNGAASTGLSTRVGGTQPSHCTALGKAMLAFASPERIDTVVAQGLNPRTSRTITDVRMFHRCLRNVSQERIAYDNSEHTMGISCIAMPVKNPAGEVVAAVSVSGPAGQRGPQEFRNALAKVTDTIGRSLRALAS